MSREQLRNFHVPLPEAIYLRLQQEAKRQGAAATQMAREVLEAFLAQRARHQRQLEIAAYAAASAGSGEDLDAELESASLEVLTAEEEA